jgi:hypothetical protein
MYWYRLQIKRDYTQKRRKEGGREGRERERRDERTVEMVSNK